MSLLMNVSRRGAIGGLTQERAVAAKCLPRPVFAAASPFGHARSTARGSQGSAARRSVVARGMVEKITSEELEVAIATRETTIIVDFFATWCGPCLLLAKELEKVAETMDGKVKVVKIDVDENPDLANMLKIQGLPTIVFIPKENGKPALRTEGWLPAAQIMEIVGQMDAGQVAAPPMPSAAPEAAQ
ncbi:Thioredoxin-like protein CITRX, chloroplastic [Tetrabaena socialis]|uniref:Thioredoxin-like protein CITRX, chloroplastic n=1 Tax=Tetrabaena socialis TaxID=47790 RepID=A0A2J7ZQ73_9CHLO|nr:Thioredoxin-like protein CITRX, chloroplastic [Tetrabaena socialis]|eukprot:PNH02406.1 Thioredoxin-like protein CITRX, chloroplastic [Tetrabaena socialis]